jgi:hypothetical protein
MVLKSQYGVIVVLPDATLSGTTVTATVITADTSKFCNPCTKLEFTSNIIGTAFAVTLNFQVFKTCNNQRPIPIGSRFSFVVPVAALFANMFTFFVCDCDSCLNECCTYTVMVTVGGARITGNVGIFAARLIAITVDNPEQCC